SNPFYLVAVGDFLYFGADDGTHGRELWRTNGRPGGTTLFADINPGAAGSDPQFLTKGNGRLYFTADVGTHGRALWVLHTRGDHNNDDHDDHYDHDDHGAHDD